MGDLGNKGDVDVTVKNHSFDESNRLLVSTATPPEGPGETRLSIIQKGSISGTVDHFRLVTNGKTLTLQRFSAGAQDSVSGSVVELFEDPNGDASVLNAIEDIFLNGSSGQKDLNLNFVGNGIRKILMRRRNLGGGNFEVSGRYEGFEK